MAKQRDRNVAIDPAIHQRLKVTAAATGRTMTEMADKALKEALDREREEREKREQRRGS